MQKAMFAEYRAGLATGLRTLQRRARAAALIAIYLGCMATAGETLTLAASHRIAGANRPESVTVTITAPMANQQAERHSLQRS